MPHSQIPNQFGALASMTSTLSSKKLIFSTMALLAHVIWLMNIWLFSQVIY